MRRLLSLAVLSFVAPALAQAPAAPTPITLEQTMADPDWIGPAVEQAWWSWDGQRAQYTLKRAGATIRDTWQVPVAGYL